MYYTLSGKYAGTDLNVLGALANFVYLERLDGLSCFKLKMCSTDWSVWDELIKDDLAPGRFQWGFVGGDQTPIKDVVFTSGKIKYKREMVFVDVDGIDAGYYLCESGGGKAYVDAKISNIVADIASRTGFYVDIEETKGKYTLYQCDYSDASFIKEELLPRAVGVSGRSDFQFYVKDGNTIVFKPIKIDVPKYFFSLNPTEKDSGKMTMDGIEIDFDRINLSKSNSWHTEFRGFDVVGKAPLFTRLKDSVVDYPLLAPNKPVIDRAVDSTVSFPLVESDESYQSMFDNRSKGIWLENIRHRFRTCLVCGMGIIPLLGDIVNVTVKDSKGGDHMSSGNYLIYAIKHKFTRAKPSIYLYLERRTSR